MRKIILTYGLIGGVIVSAMLFITIAIWSNKDGKILDGSMWLGYTTMVISLSTIFFAVRNYRDNHGGGLISFWKAFKVGILITLVAGVLYAITWEICYNTIAQGFTESMIEHYEKQLDEQDLTEAEKATERQKMQVNMELYKNPVVRFVFTIFEILPVGLLISIFSALVLRRRQIPPVSRQLA